MDTLNDLAREFGALLQSDVYRTLSTDVSHWSDKSRVVLSTLPRMRSRLEQDTEVPHSGSWMHMTVGQRSLPHEAEAVPAIPRLCSFFQVKIDWTERSGEAYSKMTPASGLRLPFSSPPG